MGNINILILQRAVDKLGSFETSIGLNDLAFYRVFSTSLK